jgi:hypothetical protein
MGGVLQTTYDQEGPAVAAAADLCVAMDAPDPRHGATPRSDCCSHLALAWAVATRGDEDDRAIALAMLEAASVGHPIDGFDPQSMTVSVVVPSPHLVER